MKYERWIGSHGCVSSDERVDGNLSFNDRSHTETQDIDDLIHWLEYANTGYPAARQSVDQEEYWAKLLRNLLCEDLVKHLVFFNDYTFECRCKLCNLKFNGDITTDGLKLGINNVPCEHIKDRFSDIVQYILNEFEVRL